MKVAGVVGLADGEYRLAEPDAMPPDLVVVSGPPASGKTSWLRAVVASKEQVAAYGPKPNPKDLVRPLEPGAKVVASYWLEADEVTFAGVDTAEQALEVVFRERGLPESDADPGLIAVLDRYGHHGGFGIMDLLPERRSMMAAGRDVGKLETAQRMRRLSFEPDKYGGLIRFVRETLAAPKSPGAKLLTSLFGELCGWLTLEASDELPVAFAHRAGHRVPLERLSASEREYFLLAANFVMLTPVQSIILFDRPELHLPGDDAARVLSALRKREPTNQWIVATNESKILAMASDRAAVRLTAAAS